MSRAVKGCVRGVCQRPPAFLRRRGHVPWTLALVSCPSASGTQGVATRWQTVVDLKPSPHPPEAVGSPLTTDAHLVPAAGPTDIAPELDRLSQFIESTLRMCCCPELRCPSLVPLLCRRDAPAEFPWQDNSNTPPPSQCSDVVPPEAPTPPATGVRVGSGCIRLASPGRWTLGHASRCSLAPQCVLGFETGDLRTAWPLHCQSATLRACLPTGVVGSIHFAKYAWGAWSSAVCPFRATQALTGRLSIYSAYPGRHAGVHGAPGQLRRALRAPPKCCLGACASVVRPQGALQAL